VRNAISPGFLSLKTLANLLRLTLYVGPKLLLTSRLSGKSASMMIMLCAPALLCCAMLTLPALIFQSPQQQAYFYFAQVLNQDPIRWVGLTLALICTFIALAVPATESNPFTAVRR
jgi:hypothetical protein